MIYHDKDEQSELAQRITNVSIEIMTARMMGNEELDYDDCDGLGKSSGDQLLLLWLASQETVLSSRHPVRSLNVTIIGKV